MNFSLKSINIAGLRDAVRRRHAGTLEKAIHIARASPFALQLASAISAADKLRAQLKQWRVHRHAPLDMEQATVSEIRSFKYPPSSVVTVMTAVHRLLGYRRRDVAVSIVNDLILYGALVEWERWWFGLRNTAVC